jgi:hypothetical protein
MIPRPGVAVGASHRPGEAGLIVPGSERPDDSGAPLREGVDGGEGAGRRRGDLAASDRHLLLLATADWWGHGRRPLLTNVRLVNPGTPLSAAQAGSPPS